MWVDKNIFSKDWENKHLIDKITGIGKNSWQWHPKQNCHDALEFLDWRLSKDLDFCFEEKKQEEANEIKTTDIFFLWDLDDDNNKKFGKKLFNKDCLLLKDIINKKLTKSIEFHLFIFCFNFLKIWEIIQEKGFDKEKIKIFIIDYNSMNIKKKIKIF